MSPEEFARIEMLERQGYSLRKACGNEAVRKAYRKEKRLRADLGEGTNEPRGTMRYTSIADLSKVGEDFFLLVANEAVGGNESAKRYWGKLLFEILKVLPTPYNDKQQTAFTPDVYRAVLESICEKKEL